MDAMSGQQFTLTAGTIPRILTKTPDEEIELSGALPTCQLLFVKLLKINQKNSVEALKGSRRYLVILSDGEHFMQAILGKQPSYQSTEGELEKNTVVIIENWTHIKLCNMR